MSDCGCSRHLPTRRSSGAQSYCAGSERDYVRRRHRGSSSRIRRAFWRTPRHACDSSVYAIALLAIGRSIAFKSRGARVSGGLLAILGLGVVIESVRRAVMGAEPEGWIIVGIATMSLLVNATVLRMLAKYRDGEVHLRASWIFTRADVIANLGVIVAGLLVLGIGAPWPDFVIGAGIGLYVIREAVEILRDPRQRTARYRPSRQRELKW